MTQQLPTPSGSFRGFDSRADFVRALAVNYLAVMSIVAILHAIIVSFVAIKCGGPAAMEWNLLPSANLGFEEGVLDLLIALMYCEFRWPGSILDG